MSLEHDQSPRGRLDRVGRGLMARLPRWPILALALVIGIGLGVFLPERPDEHRIVLPQAQVAVPLPAETVPPPAESVPAAPPAPPAEVPPVPETAPETLLPVEPTPPPARSEAPSEPSAAPGDRGAAPSVPPEAPPVAPPSVRPAVPSPGLADRLPSPGADMPPRDGPPDESIAAPPPSAPSPAIPSPDSPPAVAQPPATPPLPAPPSVADKPPAPSRSDEQARLPPGLPPVSSDVPPWRRFAVAPPAVAGRPMVAVIIDDMGLDVRRSRLMMELPGPLTMSFIPYARDLARQTAAARGFGHELMVHVSMEPLNAAIDPGPNALTVDLDAAEIHRRLVWALNTFDGYVGINNHMGSRFTTDRPGMSVVMKELKSRGLLFLDSRTVQHSLGGAIATQYGVPNAGRSLFIDNVLSVDAVMKELVEIEQLAGRARIAVAIGHPHDATLAALKDWLPTLAEKGIALVPVSAIVARQEERRAAGSAKSSASP